MEDQARISPEASFLLLMLGFFLILIGFFLVLAGLFPSSNIVGAEGGGVILIGPIPILFHGELGPLAVLLIFIVMALAFLLPLMHFLRLRKAREEGRE